MKRLFPILLLIVLAMIFAPCAIADSILSLEATSGFISVSTGNFSVSGPGFTFTGFVNIFFCPSLYAPGDPIQGCDTSFLEASLGSGALVLNGVTQPFAVIDSIPTASQAPMFLSGATQATLTEPAFLSDVFSGCLGNTLPCGFGLPGEPFEIATGSTEFSISLTLDPSGSYDVTNEVYTIVSTPEPGTDVLLLSSII